MTDDKMQAITNWIALLDKERREMLEALENVSADKVIYPENGWRVKDLVGHIAYWEEHSTLSLEAYARGEEYIIPGYISLEPANAQAYQERKHYTEDRIYDGFVGARERLKAALRALSPEQAAGQLLCPWKKYSTVERLVIDLADHEREHREEIQRTV